MLVDVEGDANCLYRSVSYALYGTQVHHRLLRLTAAIEVLLHPSFYDSCSDNYYKPYRMVLYLVRTRHLYAILSKLVATLTCM